MSLLRFEQELNKLSEEVRHWKGEHGDAVRREAAAVWDIDQVKADLEEAVRFLREAREFICQPGDEKLVLSNHAEMAERIDTFIAQIKAKP